MHKVSASLQAFGVQLLSNASESRSKLKKHFRPAWMKKPTLKSCIRGKWKDGTR